MLKQTYNSARAAVRKPVSDTAPAQVESGCPKLALLCRELESKAAQLDASERFLFHKRAGDRPSLWIDRDAKLEGTERAHTYRFLCHTRRGWLVLMETDQFTMLEQLSLHYVSAKSTGCALLEMAIAAEG